MPLCPECHGGMAYDPSVKKFVCKSCGLTLSQQEVIELRDKSREEETAEERKKREHNEYLKWWLSKKD